MAVLLCTSPAAGQAPTDTTTPAPQAPVVLAGDTLFVIQTSLGPFGPVERAERIATQLTRILNDPTRSDDTIAVAVGQASTDILVGDVTVTTVTDADARAAGVTREELVAQRVAAVTAVLRPATIWGVSTTLLWGALKAAIATAVLILVLRLLSRVMPRVYQSLESLRSRLPSIRIQQLELLSADREVEILLGVARAVRLAIVALLLINYIPLVLSFFPWTRGLSGRIFSYFLEPLERFGSGFVAFLPNLITILVLLVVFRYALKFVHLFFQGIERKAIALPGFYAEWAEPTYKIVRFLGIVFIAIVIYPYLPGTDTAAFKGISVFLGVLVSLGSAGAIANIVAGVVMTYMRPFQIGDRVKIADTVGDVIEQTLLVTRIRTNKNVDITIPNAIILSNHIINYSRTGNRGELILHTSVTIGYDAPWRKVHELLLAAADATEGLLKEPKPYVLQTSLSDFYVSYEINAYSDQPNAMAGIYSELHQNIQDKFNEAGVEIMSPHYSALRDGNQVTIPADHLPKNYRAPAFRWAPVETGRGTTDSSGGGG
jgi:small-conductance mechanosensitive channel